MRMTLALGSRITFMANATRHVRFHTLMHVVAQSLKPVKLVLAMCKRTQQLPNLPSACHLPQPSCGWQF